MNSILKKFLPLFALLAASALVYAATCGISSGGSGSVFSVIDENGKIEIPSGACNVQFWNVSGLNVKTGNLTLPKTDKKSDECMGKGTSLDQPIVATNTVAIPPNYGDFVPSTGTDSTTSDGKTSELKAGNYNKITTMNGAKLTVLGSSNFQELTCNGDEIIFAPGVYMIGKLNH